MLGPGKGRAVRRISAAVERPFSPNPGGLTQYLFGVTARTESPPSLTVKGHNRLLSFRRSRRAFVASPRPCPMRGRVPGGRKDGAAGGPQGRGEGGRLRRGKRWRGGQGLWITMIRSDFLPQEGEDPNGS